VPPVYDWGVSEKEPSITPSRSLFIGATSVLLLSIPFFVFGLAFLDTKARIELQCESGGPCTVTRAGWLTRETVGVFPLSEIQEARVERGRSPRGERQSIYRPVLVTTRGELPLSFDSMSEEKLASRVTVAINRFLQMPGAPGFTIWHDHRPRAGRMGLIFTVAAVLVLLFGLWLLWRAFKRRGEERARAVPPSA
jgi:hypothetical protein